MTDVPAGLVLGVDEYLTALLHELEIVQLDEEPARVWQASTGSLGVVAKVLTSCAQTRQVVRTMAERAYDDGKGSFELELDVPAAEAPEAAGLGPALEHVCRLSRAGQLLLPPLSEEAAGFLSQFLALAARQIQEQAISRIDPGGSQPEPTATPSTAPQAPDAPEAFPVLEQRRGEHRAQAPLLEREEHRRRRAFPRGLGSASEARHFVVDTLESWDMAACAARAELPAAELVANALLYSTKEIAVVVKADGDHVLVEVHDTAPAFPAVRRRGDEADSGRGLVLVDALADRWGYDASSDLTKRVWFELARG